MNTLVSFVLETGFNYNLVVQEIKKNSTVKLTYVKEV